MQKAFPCVSATVAGLQAQWAWRAGRSSAKASSALKQSEQLVRTALILIDAWRRLAQ